MYYIGIDQNDTNKLVYYCRHCGFKDETITEETICVLNTQLKHREQKFNHIINEYTKLDPTLPRIYTMRCPNGECSTNHTQSSDKPTEIIYMRYDDNNMKYVYICVECNTTWKTAD
jgi:DNA-directed RNA polymerase subunit M/transcription elongation factor TFIIS